MKKQQIILTTLLILGLCLTTTQTVTALKAPEQKFPENDGPFLDVSRPLFGWENLENADNYRLVIDNDEDFSSPEENDIKPENEAWPEEDLPDGTYWWKVRGENETAIGGYSDNWKLKIDTTAPTRPELKSPSDGIVENEKNLTLAWTDSTDSGGSGVDYYTVYVDKETAIPELEDNSVQYDFGSSGEYTWHVGVYDKAGNSIESEASWSVTIDIEDPSISDFSVSGRGRNTATINWTVTEEWSGLDSINISYGTSEDDLGQQVNVLDPNGSGSKELDGLSSGTLYYFEIEAVDNVGNSSTSSVENFETLAPPVSSIVSFDDYWQVSENFEVVASASDEDGLVENVTLHYRFRENSSAEWDNWENYGLGVRVSENSDNWTWSFAPSENDGFYQLYSEALDNDGLLESVSSSEENLGIDTVAPSISVIEINEDDSVTTNPDVDISIQAVDEVSGVDLMRFRIDDQDWKDWKSFESEDNHYFLPPYGERTIYVQVKDNAGLTSPVNSDSIILENATFNEPVGSIDENENKTADISDWGIIVKNVVLCAENSVDDAEIGVRVENEKPAQIDSGKPANLVRKYFRIETNCGEENFKRFTVEFSIENSWLKEQGLKPDEIEVWRFENEWKKVEEVEVVSENSTHYTYKATTSNLSWFAVTESTGSGIWIYIIITAIVVAGIVLFYLHGWEKLQPLLKTSRKSKGKGIPS